MPLPRWCWRRLRRSCGRIQLRFGGSKLDLEPMRLFFPVLALLTLLLERLNRNQTVGRFMIIRFRGWRLWLCGGLLLWRWLRWFRLRLVLFRLLR